MDSSFICGLWSYLSSWECELLHPKSFVDSDKDNLVVELKINVLRRKLHWTVLVKWRNELDFCLGVLYFNEFCCVQDESTLLQAGVYGAMYVSVLSTSPRLGAISTTSQRGSPKIQFWDTRNGGSLRWWLGWALASSDPLPIHLP